MPEKILTIRPLNLKGKKVGDSFWDNLVCYDTDGPTDISARIDDYLYGKSETSNSKERLAKGR